MSSNNLDLANLPYDPNLCAKRMWNDGLGCQCQKAAVEDGMCGRHLKMMNYFGGILPHGFYNEERPLFDLTKPTTQNHPWKDLKGRYPRLKMLVAEIREKLEEFGLDTTGKKPELLERLNNHMAANQDEEVAEPPPKKAKKEVLTLEDLHYTKTWRGKNSSALKWWRQYTN